MRKTASVTIRGLPPETVERVKAVAAQNGRSMEQELRELIRAQYRTKDEILRSIDERWARLPPVSPVRPEELKRWINEGRP